MSEERREQPLLSVVDSKMDLGQQRLFISTAFGDEVTQDLESGQSYLGLISPEAARDIIDLSQRIIGTQFKGTAIIAGEQELFATVALMRLVYAQNIHLMGCDLDKHQIKDLLTLWRFLQRQSAVPGDQSSWSEARADVSCFCK